MVSASLRTAVLGELGRPAEMFGGRRRRAPRPSGCGSRTARIVLDGIVVPWLAMAGRFDEAEARLPVIQNLDEQIVLGAGR